MNNLLYVLLVLIFPTFATSQSVDIEGKLKVSEMDTVNTENHLVVKQADGTLATRMVASLPPPIDTSRNLASDLELAKILCQCSNNMPPFLVESTLDAGYSITDLLGAGVPVSDLLAAGVSAQDLFAAGVSVQDLIAAGVSVQDLLAQGFSIQDLLDSNLTPLALYNAGAILDSLYGKTYVGGLIFYLDTNIGTGLVAAPADQSSGTKWGCYGTDLPNVTNVTTFPPSGPGAEIGDGITNTTAILSAGNCPTAPAALACTQNNGGGFSDWFLPSASELNEMWENLADSDSDGINTGPSDPNNLGGFEIVSYWSSSEFDADNAWGQAFSNGFQNNREKIFEFPQVRAIRAF